MSDDFWRVHNDTSRTPHGAKLSSEARSESMLEEKRMGKNHSSDRRRFLGAAVATLATVELGGALFAADVPAQDRGVLQRFDGANGWLNSQPLSAADLRGKVVLVDFWTYTCINWLRTLPYVRAWAEKYKDQGLVVIGVHTPE